MVKTIDEIMQSVKDRLGDDVSDDAIAFTQDISDTFNALKGNEDWKNKYEQNDAAWRQKYRDTFFSGGSGEDDPEPDPEPKKLTFEALFKEG